MLLTFEGEGKEAFAEKQSQDRLQKENEGAQKEDVKGEGTFRQF